MGKRHVIDNLILSIFGIDNNRISGKTNFPWLMVNFNEFADSSVDFFIYCFTKTTQWVKFHEVKQGVMLQIAEIIEANQAEIAFPSTTVYVTEPVTVNHS